MSKRVYILGSACNVIGGLIGVPGWLLRFARLMLVPKLRLLLREGLRQNSTASPDGPGRMLIRPPEEDLTILMLIEYGCICPGR